MIIELSILAAFGAMLCWGIGDFLIQRTARKVGDVEALAFIGIIGSIGLFPFIVAELPMLLDFHNFAILAMLGLLTFIFALFDFEALKKGKICVVDVILEFELPVSVVLGFMFFNELPSMLQFAAIGAIVAGIFLIAFGSSPSKACRRFEKGALLAVIAAVGMGTINFLTAAGSRQVSPMMAVWVPWIIFTVFSLALITDREGIRKTISNASRFKWLVLAMGIFDTVAWVFFAFSSLTSMLSITVAITESYPAIAMMLGVWLNKEKIAAHQYAGAGIALVASFALGFLI